MPAFFSSEKRCIVESLAKEVGLQVKVTSPVTNLSYGGLDEDTKQIVLTFYNTNEVSWQAPGRKDRVIIRETQADGSKSKRTEQVRYMLTSLKEAHQQFSSEHPEIMIGLSKFCELRPTHVKLFDHIPHNVCVCSYHENVRLLLVALKPYTAFSVEFRGFINQVTCDDENKKCMSRDCEKCKGFFDTFAPQNGDDSIKYQQWQKNCDDKVEKVEILGIVTDAFSELKKQLRYFFIHTYVKRKQAAHFSDLVSKCNETHVVLQVDFSENASIVSQNEIQSAHWTHGQVTIYTGHVWVKTGISKGLVIVSDALNHTKQSVYSYMSYIFKYLKENYPTIEEVTIFSDGAAQQFKQKYLFSNLYSWEREFDFVLKWNFFATSHGKGAVDGIGETIKRSVWREVRNGHVNINTPAL